MFREMRRKNQLLSDEDSLAVLCRCTSGVLAVSGDGGYPYAVPLSYVHSNGRLYFHCATTGHKLDAIARQPKVSFCVIDQDVVAPAEYSTRYRSVIVFGTARVLQNEEEIRRALELLSSKYFPNDREGSQREIDAQISRLCVIEFTIEHLTGKEAKELVAETRQS